MIEINESAPLCSFGDVPVVSLVVRDRFTKVLAVFSCSFDATSAKGRSLVPASEILTFLHAKRWRVLGSRFV